MESAASPAGSGCAGVTAGLLLTPGSGCSVSAGCSLGVEGTGDAGGGGLRDAGSAGAGRGCGAGRGRRTRARASAFCRAVTGAGHVGSVGSPLFGSVSQ